MSRALRNKAQVIIDNVSYRKGANYCIHLYQFVDGTLNILHGGKVNVTIDRTKCLPALENAESLLILREERKGIYHMTAEGQTSWYGFAKHIIDNISSEGKKVKRVIPIKTKDYLYQAERPMYSVMSNTRMNVKYQISLNSWLQQFNMIINGFYYCTSVNANCSIRTSTGGRVCRK